MKTKLPNAREFPRFSGICTFFRFPYQEQPSAVDWALYGVPYDYATTYRAGARFGPRAIREQSAYIKPYHLEYQESLIERYSLVDAGDAPIVPFDLNANQDAHYRFAKLWRDQGAKTFAIGGDHSISPANMKATFESAGQPLALIHFDSHTDTVDELWGQKYSHASPIRRGIEEGYFEKGKCLSIGIKGPLNSATEFLWGDANGVEVVTHSRFQKEGFQPLIEFKNKIGNQPVYLTFDIDCVDPVYAPGTGTPAVGGFTSVEALDLVRQFKGINLAGADLVEVAPHLESGYLTSLLGAQLIFEILSL